MARGLGCAVAKGREEFCPRHSECVQLARGRYLMPPTRGLGMKPGRVYVSQCHLNPGMRANTSVFLVN